MARAKNIVPVPYQAHPDRAAWFDIVGSRIKPASAPTRAALRAFKSHSSLYLGAVRDANAKDGAYTAVLYTVGTHDSKLDLLLEELARAMAGAGIGTRANPFKGFVTHSPSRLKGLAYADEATEASDLLDGIAKAAKRGELKLEGNLKAAYAACKKQVAVVKSELRKLQKPGDAFDLARKSRDRSHAKAFSALQTLGAYAAGDHGANSDQFQSLFAPADPILLHKHKRKLRVHDTTAPALAAASTAPSTPAKT